MHAVTTPTAHTPDYLDQLLDADEAGRFVGMTGPALQTLRTRGGGPAYVKLGRRVRYRRGDLIAWIQAHRRTSTSVGAEAA
ncbi:putative DNA-binding transcriptional regulator AlpA [Constrictibacter sp. MBR-5]|jgi:predicted DNA-binding transcriptional regulator AlpA|uniref:helix-turn-helix transcriptional regulator n=1 Tax=Constrictibacter sp. MBR-5 TaxID=3156467 RepID=UPI003399FE5A